jgi:PKD domain
VTDSTVSAPEGAGLGPVASETTVRRSTLSAKIGAIALAGHLTITDSVIDMRGKAGGGGAVGLYAFRTGNGPTTVAADGQRLTIVGSTPGSMETIGVGAFADGAGMTAGVDLRDSVINGIGVPIARKADNGGAASMTTEHSASPSSLATPSLTDVGPGKLVEHDHLTVRPRFVDGAGGNFRLAADSPLIDAGTRGALPAGALDRDGRPRAADGDGDCAHVPDVGAFEDQGTKVTAVATAAAASVATGQAVGFSAAGSCIPGPGAPTIRWSFDDGAAATGATVIHAFRHPGPAHHDRHRLGWPRPPIPGHRRRRRDRRRGHHPAPRRAEDLAPARRARPGADRNAVASARAHVRPAPAQHDPLQPLAQGDGHAALRQQRTARAQAQAADQAAQGA